MGRRAINFRKPITMWADFLRQLVARERVTDIINYGDGRTYHRIAAEIAAERGINAYVYEFGYLRPDWITLERGGMSTRSHFPTDPNVIREIGRQFPMPDLRARTHYTMSGEMTHEMTYNLVSYFLSLTFPNYTADRYYNPLIEYATGMAKQFRSERMKREAKSTVATLIREKRAFFFVPLQLQCDYQLRHHSRFAHQGDAIREVITSFANHAPKNATLVFKCHPLDNGAEHWPEHIEKHAREAGLEEARVTYIEGGDLATLLKHARGAVMINSTVGMHALITRCPTKILGTALFDIEKLTHQGSLDSFWSSPEQPDTQLVDALVRALAGTIQVKGDFFTKPGRESAIATFVERILSGSVNGAGAFVDPPPRLARS